jgi:hypothetical protein
MPIQGEKNGSQEEQRIFREFDERFVTIESVIAKFGGVAIRIDKEHPLEDLVGRIKKEISSSKFVIADLTDERPSCYFEAGYAEALQHPAIYVASKQSVSKPGTSTEIHFDIHIGTSKNSCLKPWSPVRSGSRPSISRSGGDFLPWKRP